MDKKKNTPVEGKKPLSRRDFLLGMLGIAGGVGASIVYGEVRKFSDGKDYTPENLIMNFGPYGTYRAVYDSERNAWTLGFWKENLVLPGSKNLTDLKREGGRIVFQMPFDGAINNSAGQISIDDEKWQLGNPALNMQNDPRIAQGQEIDLSYEANNDSAGFQLWFES